MAKAPEDVSTTAISTTTCKVGLFFILKTYLYPHQTVRGQKSPKIMKIVLDKALTQEEGTWDNIDGRRYGISISKYHRCGQKHSGEEVSVSLGYLCSRTMDMPNRKTAVECILLDSTLYLKHPFLEHLEQKAEKRTQKKKACLF